MLFSRSCLKSHSKGQAGAGPACLSSQLPSCPVLVAFSARCPRFASVLWTLTWVEGDRHRWAFLFRHHRAVRRVTAPTPQPLRSSQLFSSHFSRTLITDLHPNRCEDTSTVQHRELRQSPETNAFPAANFSPLFDNIWPRSAQPQVHAKQQNSMLSPIEYFAYNYRTIIDLTHFGVGGAPPRQISEFLPAGPHR